MSFFFFCFSVFPVFFEIAEYSACYKIQETNNICCNEFFMSRKNSPKTSINNR